MFIICIIPFLEYKLHEDKKLSLLFTDRFKVTGTLSGKCDGGGRGTVRFFFLIGMLGFHHILFQGCL